MRLSSDGDQPVPGVDFVLLDDVRRSCGADGDSGAEWALSGSRQSDLGPGWPAISGSRNVAPGSHVPQAFVGEANPYTIRNVARAMAAFERTIVGADSAWDRFHYGDETAISESAKRGEILFFTDGGPQCFRCHSGFNFSGEDEYHNTALYDPYPPPNLGLFAHTRRAEDAGKFKAPTLRNIAVTAPYMHDGSIATLEEVLEHYAAGGRAHGNPGKDPLVRGFTMTVQNRVDLVAFLKSLTDEGLLHDPRFANPWPPAR